MLATQSLHTNIIIINFILFFLNLSIQLFSYKISTSSTIFKKLKYITSNGEEKSFTITRTILKISSKNNLLIIISVTLHIQKCRSNPSYFKIFCSHFYV